jgi:hypothetical protein
MTGNVHLLASFLHIIEVAGQLSHIQTLLFGINANLLHQLPITRLAIRFIAITLPPRKHNIILNKNKIYRHFYQ